MMPAAPSMEAAVVWPPSLLPHSLFALLVGIAVAEWGKLAANTPWFVMLDSSLADLA
jgi:hypothetical protein